MPDSTAPSFFVSYSHHDADWRAALFDRCIATTSGDCLVWSDAQLRAGDAWCPQIEAQLAGHGGPWLLGQDYGVADAYGWMLCRWTRGMQRPARTLVEALVAGQTPEQVFTHAAAEDSAATTIELLRELAKADALMAQDHEIGGILHALDGRFLRPGDVMRSTITGLGTQINRCVAEEA